jgi:diacylglycerol O-acyltransferase / wax synthase
MQRLSGMDASFLYMETPTRHMHVSGVLILDPSTMQGGYEFARIRELIQSRIHLMPMLRRRAVAVPLGIDHPVWIEDPDLDRNRPLWEMSVVEGLDDGCIALVTKLHHACIDGVTGADMMAHLLDLEPDAEGPPPPDEPWVPDEVPSDLNLSSGAVVARLTDPLRGVRAASRAGRSLLEMAKGMTGIGADKKLNVALPFSGPKTVLNAPVTPNRVVAFGAVLLDDLKAIKSAFGTTVNDVVLVASAMSLHQYLADHDDLPDRPLIAAVPVSVHGQTESDGTNQVSNMFVRLPMDAGEPVEQLARIHEETKDAKAVHNAMGVDLIQDMAQITPPGVYNLAMRLYSNPRISGTLPPVQNLVISNVPGPPIPLYIAGAQVRGIYPFGPLIEGSGINITVLSNMGNVDIGVIACGDTVPDVWDIVDGFADAVKLLKKAADEQA